MAETCELEMNESCAGASFSLKRGDRIVVDRDIELSEAIAWVEGRRARVVRGDLPGVKGGAAAAPAMIGTPPAERTQQAEETTVIRRGRRG